MSVSNRAQEMAAEEGVHFDKRSAIPHVFTGER
jgi:hypothetical protein